MRFSFLISNSQVCTYFIHWQRFTSVDRFLRCRHDFFFLFACHGCVNVVIITIIIIYAPAGIVITRDISIDNVAFLMRSNLFSASAKNRRRQTFSLSASNPDAITFTKLQHLPTSTTVKRGGLGIYLCNYYYILYYPLKFVENNFFFFFTPYHMFTSHAHIIYRALVYTCFCWSTSVFYRTNERNTVMILYYYIVRLNNARCLCLRASAPLCSACVFGREKR